MKPNFLVGILLFALFGIPFSAEGRSSVADGLDDRLGVFIEEKGIEDADGMTLGVFEEFAEMENAHDIDLSGTPEEIYARGVRLAENMSTIKARKHFEALPGHLPSKARLLHMDAIDGKDIDRAEAKRIFEELSKTGDSTALALLYQFEIGTPAGTKNHDNYRKSCEMRQRLFERDGKIDGIGALAFCHQSEYGFDNREKATEIAMNACNGGDPSACIWLWSQAFMEKADFGVQRGFLEKAMQNGSPVAMSLLGLEYFYGKHVRKDVKKAAAYFKKAIEAGSESDSNNFLSATVKSGDHDEDELFFGLVGLAKEAMLGVPKSMGIWAVFCEGSEIPGSPDFPRAREWWRKAAEAGNAIACRQYARALKDGIGGPKDAKEAEKWLKRAGELEDGK